MNTRHEERFTLTSRILHWLMAAMILAMLLIGLSMVGSLVEYHRLVSIHRPLGIAIGLLAVFRLINRFRHPAPQLPTAMPAWQRVAALLSHVALYFFMFALPLVGWAMSSAADYPVVLFGSVHLPSLLAPNPPLYAHLRTAHTVLAVLLLLTFLAHMSAALMHALVFRDGVFRSMSFRKRAP